MEKVPTIFERDWDNDPSRVTRQVHEGCEWVLAGEGTPSKKYDGTCVMYEANHWWARREVKEGKEAPENFVSLTTDEETGKTIGWEPIEQSPFKKFFEEAVQSRAYWDEGTYELIGPKINRNPEGASRHTLIGHANAETLGLLDRSYDGIQVFLSGIDIEGIVFRHPDGRLAKIKKRDYGMRR